MSFEVIAASYREQEKVRTPLQQTLLSGATMGAVGIFLASVGIIKMFHQRWIIVDVLSLGHAVLVLICLFAGVLVARKSIGRSPGAVALQGLAAGAMAAAMISVLSILIASFNLRVMFVALSKPLLNILTFELGVAPGIASFIAIGAVLGLVGAMIYMAPPRIRRPLTLGLAVAGMTGLFQELLQLMMQHDGPINDFRALLFTWDGLKLSGAIGIALVVGGASALWDFQRERVHGHYGQLPPTQQRAIRVTGIGIGLLVLMLIPLAAGNFIGQVFMLVGLYVLMGMGLNLELGFAGLLDLGFVAFFAVGAYTTALLTADTPYALANWSYWQALPVAVLLSLVIGVLFGVPVLKVRGDYLAVATLGLGEIVRVIVLSDMAEPVLGGAQGLLNIPRPSIAGFELDDPVDLFYLTLVCSGVVAFIAWRLQRSRLGRAWNAIRDDEDVAQALGINLVNVKLLAYGIGATFAGVAGSIFGVMLGSIFPHSFQLLISINVLALIIVGGMGSLPGVVVGAAVLIGLPELLREFGEYRFLFYGLVIVVMMRIKAEGLWPSEAVKRERRSMAAAEEAVEAELHGGGAPAPAATAAAKSPER